MNTKQGKRKGIGVGFLVCGAMLVAAIAGIYISMNNASKVAALEELKQFRDTHPRVISSGNVIDWWDVIPEDVLQKTIGVKVSNITRSDYAGAESCQGCHEENYENWSDHPHRRMNALANDETVVGDFSGAKTITYKGGVGKFYKEDSEFRMHLQRDDIVRTYRIHQTLGSRFYQYYIGKMISGPEPDGHVFYTEDHVLPFGFWIDKKMWVPIVHTHRTKYDKIAQEGDEISEDELPDEFRNDPFKADSEEISYVPYHSCNHCHTTFALGDLFITAPNVLGRHAPRKMHFSLSNYISDNYPDYWKGDQHPAETEDETLMPLLKSIVEWEAPEHAVSLGISCESCHMGSKRHVDNERSLPKFAPMSPHLHLEGHGELVTKRNHENLNWICGRCHTGDRPQLAAGMATWNSTEYTDALRGACYSEMTCVHCHDPHTKIGKQWKPTPEQDDNKCISCHQEFKEPDALVAHTHHPVGNEGSNCMNCHMPRINEGLQDVVRTHMIFSPTNSDMIHANQPNACNQCHTQQPIDWTLKHLKDWYGKTYDETQIAKNYPKRQQPTALGWLQSDNASVRLVAADSLGRSGSRWAIPDMIKMLDDPFLLNRQFASVAFEKMMEIKLDDYGYRFYMGTDQRKEPLAKLRREFQKETAASE